MLDPGSQIPDAGFQHRMPGYADILKSFISCLCLPAACDWIGGG